MKRIVHFERRPFSNHYSIEIIFQLVRAHLKEKYIFCVKPARFHSNGIFKRLYNTLEPLFFRGNVYHVLGDTYYQAIFLPKKCTILTLHGGLLPFGGVSHLANWFYKKFWYELPARHATIITTVSAFSKKDILSVLDVPPEKIVVIHNPVQPIFTYTPKKFNSTKPIILQIGTFPLKNLTRLVLALEGVSCHLRIVGEPSKADLQLLYNKNIEYSVIKNLSPQEMFEEYKRCDILSFISIYESFGIPIVEAQAVGRPVLTSNTTAMPEVAGAASACYVNPLDVQDIKKGIFQIIENEYFRNNIIAQGLENVKRFDARKIAAQYAALYEEILSVSDLTIKR